MNKEQFAKKIIRLRKKKGYTQAQLAELLNVSNKAVSRWETAEGYPDITLLKPLSEALGISCDELLGDTESYSDLSRYDLQRYLPYALTLLALLLYYVFLKLQISQLLSFAAFLGMMVFSFMLMIQHTDKKGLPSLTRWNLLLVYFPLVSFLQYVYIMYLLLQFGFANILEAMAVQTEEVFNPASFLLSGFETGILIYMLIYVVALLLLAAVYGFLRHAFIMRYAVSWSSLCKKTHVREQEEKNILFRKWSDKGETMVRIAMPLAAAATLTVIFLLLYQEYCSLIDQFHNTVPPIYNADDYALTASNELLSACRGKLLLILGGSCLLQLIPAMKSRRALYHMSNIGTFFLYGVITLLFTTIEDRFYIKLPFAFSIIAGILLVLWYCRGFLRDRAGKRHSAENVKNG